MTLAELLLTITVIGIVATMSIPSMLTSINRTKNITALKKSYTNMTQLGFYIKVEMGGVLTAQNISDHYYWYNYFKKYLSYAAAYGPTQSALTRKLIGKIDIFLPYPHLIPRSIQFLLFGVRQVMNQVFY